MAPDRRVDESVKWLTSDLHIGHANICAYTGRPYSSVDEMNEDIVRRWNSKVASDDEVWVLGDVAMGKIDLSLLYISQLNGTKYLVPGNHDRMFGCEGTKYANMVQKYLDAGFTEILDEQIMLIPRFADADGWPHHATIACHFPYAGDHDDQAEDRYQDKRPNDRGDWLVHGHTHGLWRKRGHMVDVGVDAWGGYPVLWADALACFSVSDDLDVLPWLPNDAKG